MERETVEGARWRTSYSVHLDLGQGLTPREHAILSNSAHKCEIYKLMTGAIEFTYHCEP